MTAAADVQTGQHIPRAVSISSMEFIIVSSLKLHRCYLSLVDEFTHQNTKQYNTITFCLAHTNVDSKSFLIGHEL